VDTKTLFTGRAEHYRRHRPTYPPEVLDLLEREAGWSSGSIVADVGSGTGIASAMFLARGNTVFAVEPNADMRRVAEEALGRHPRFHSVAGSAERTTLPDASVDAVACATSFHWFDVAASRAELGRILRPGGCVALLWNVRRSNAPGLMADYERVLREHEADEGSRDERDERDRRTVERISAFFAPGAFNRRVFEHLQPLGLEGVKGRYASGSHASLPGDPRFDSAMRALEALFERHAVGGAVTFVYDTYVYWGRLSRVPRESSATPGNRVC
jgi:SAM-dependent methyltransferase